ARRDAHLVDQPEIINVHGYLGVVNRPKRLGNPGFQRLRLDLIERRTVLHLWRRSGNVLRLGSAAERIPELFQRNGVHGCPLPRQSSTPSRADWACGAAAVGESSASVETVPPRFSSAASNVCHASTAHFTRTGYCRMPVNTSSFPSRGLSPSGAGSPVTRPRNRRKSCC